MNETHVDPSNTVFTAALKKTRSFGFKAFLIAVLLLIFLIPLGFVSSIVRDRQGFKAEAVRSILDPLGGEFSLDGLALVIEYQVPYESSERLENGQIKTLLFNERNLLILSPSSYELAAQTTSADLTRGIFSVPTYKGALRIKAQFDIPNNSYLTYGKNGLLENSAFLSLGLSSNKNLLGFPHMVSEKTTLVRRNNKENLSDLYANDIQFEVQNLIHKEKSFELAGDIAFQGGNALRFAPLAGDNRFSVQSDWKTPAFSGGWLPIERSISDDGFVARWQISGISTKVDPVSNYTKIALQKEKVGGTYYGEYDSPDKITVRFFTPVESYRKTERSIKYALLFLLVPFLTIFLFEIFIKIKIHPVQYCLIGLANIIFYLLLLSVSEHLSFNLSYVLSAVSVTVLTSAYIGSILRSIKWAGLIALIQVVSYVFLFGTLQAEDYALLIGSLGLFVVVAGLMLITRKIDWYGREN